MAKKKQATRPQLKLCAAAWTLTNYPSEAKQWVDRPQSSRGQGRWLCRLQRRS